MRKHHCFNSFNLGQNTSPNKMYHSNSRDMSVFNAIHMHHSSFDAFKLQVIISNLLSRKTKISWVCTGLATSGDAQNSGTCLCPVCWQSKNTQVPVSSCTGSPSWEASAARRSNPKSPCSLLFHKHRALRYLLHQSSGGIHLAFCAHVQYSCTSGVEASISIVKKHECCKKECMSCLWQPTLHFSSLFFNKFPGKCLLYLGFSE